MKGKNIPEKYLTKAREFILACHPGQNPITIADAQPLNFNKVQELATLMHEHHLLTMACKDIEDPVTTIPKMATSLYEIRDCLQSDDVKLQTNSIPADVWLGGIFARVDEVLACIIKPPLTDTKQP